MQKVRRTMGGLREALFEELDALRGGEITPSRARASASIGNAIVQSVSTEITASSSNGSATKLGDLKIGLPGAESASA